MNLVEVKVDSIRVSLMSPQRVILLRQIDATRYLPIWVGPYEAEAITVALQELEMSRPLTHDLLKNVFEKLGARLLQVEIVSLRNDIFYGEIVLEFEGEVMRIDSRPSDAIALAVRANIPIFVAEEVLLNAGILPEQDIRVSEPPPHEKPPEEDEKRLSVFEDFLEELNKKKSGDEDAPPLDPPPDIPPL
jgi:bifunctional DNase/RNase